MIRRPPISTRTYTLFPYTTLFRSQPMACRRLPNGGEHRVIGLRHRLFPDAGGLAVQHSAHLGGKGHIRPFPGCFRKRLHKVVRRSEEHTSELQSLMRISYAVFCLKKKKHILTNYYKCKLMLS